MPLRGPLAIGEIVRRFAVIALQEVKGDLRALRDLLKWLGPDWAFLMTDTTLGAAGNSERMAFLFDRRRVEPSGLACELVVPEEWFNEIAPDALRRQFARTPYAVSFRSGRRDVHPRDAARHLRGTAPRTACRSCAASPAGCGSGRIGRTPGRRT